MDGSGGGIVMEWMDDHGRGVEIDRPRIIDQ